MEDCTKNTRTESDLIGSMEVPAEALYGVQTLRGIENFPISSFHLNDYPLFINGLAITKLAAAQANHQLGLLTDEQFNAISQACREILEGKHDDLPEGAFYMVGTIEDAIAKAETMKA